MRHLHAERASPADDDVSLSFFSPTRECVSCAERVPHYLYPLLCEQPASAEDRRSAGGACVSAVYESAEARGQPGEEHERRCNVVVGIYRLKCGDRDWVW